MLSAAGHSQQFSGAKKLGCGFFVLVSVNHFISLSLDLLIREMGTKIPASQASHGSPEKKPVSSLSACEQLRAPGTAVEVTPHLT